MSTLFDFDRLLTSTIHDSGPTKAPSGLADASLALARGVNQRRPMLTALDRRAWPARGVSSGDPAITFPPHRAALIGVLALLLLGLLAVVLAAGRAPDPLLPIAKAPSTIVTEGWNGLRDPDSTVSHSAFPPGTAVGTPALGSLPSNAVGLRWSPDGSRLAYWERDAPAGQRSLVLRGLFLARGDGTDPVPIVLPRASSDYAANGWWNGVRWAPTGDRFALAWDIGGCSDGDGPDCIPPTGIDVFDVTGQLVAAISVLDSPGIDIVWSPDGLAVGWMTGSCPDGICTNDAFLWRPVADGSSVTTLPLDPGGWVVWSDANRLLAVALRNETTVTGNEIHVTTFVERVYSMTPDGGDMRDVPWTNQADGLIPAWSPDGRRLAAIDPATGKLTILDVASGTEIVVDVPAGLSIAAWAPDGDRLVLSGASATNPQNYALSVVAADGTGFTPLGDGDDFAWMPVAAGPAP